MTWLGVTHIYLSSSDSKDRFNRNSPKDFTVHLSEPLNLEGDGWYCTLTELTLPPLKDGKTDRISYICSDICSASTVGERKLPILRRIRLSRKKTEVIIFDPPLYVAVRQHAIETIRVYIHSANGESPTFDTGEAHCTLSILKKQ